ncbi:Nucleolar protein [Actinidia chinensis var. chinensis]|uniref:Nucleolar protein n=1 Tax=Actinidia chinensis var. chinensis TaxID=1590841 RepID=A0A2R6PMJ5_ACTCC|nr:Nucleolar protein [Actinidia chinensis var. chinensis]
MATKPNNNNNNNAKSNGGSSSGPDSSTIFTTLFGNIPEQQSSVSIFSDDNPFRRKRIDRTQPPNQQQDQEKQQLGSGFGSAENPNFVEEKKRKRNVEKKPGSESGSVGEKIRKSKKGERKGSGFVEESEEIDEGDNGDLGFDSKELSKREKGKKHKFGSELKEGLEIEKGKGPDMGTENQKIGMEAEGSEKKKKKKRKRDEVEAEYEARHYGAVETNGEGGEGGLGGKVVGEKRKKVDDAVDLVALKEGFDDEAKLLRTVFVGNLPLKVKKKALLKEFSQFGEVESVRIRSVPLLDTKTPRKGAIIQKKINDAVDSVHAYIVFKTEEAAQTSLAHNMAVVGGNHIRVDRACPPRKKLKGESVPLYDNKRTIFVGNLPFDVKDEEIYQLFSAIKDLESSIEAIRVIRDPGTSLGKGIAYILFKTRGAANLVAKKRSLKLRDRELRLCHAKSNLTPSKRGNPSPTERNYTPTKKLAVDSQTPDSNNKLKTKAASSYQGLKGSKSGVQKKVHPRLVEPMKFKSRTPNGENPKERNKKRPTVAARKANALKVGGASKQTGNKRKLESRTPESARRNKKTKKFR